MGRTSEAMAVHDPGLLDAIEQLGSEALRIRQADFAGLGLRESDLQSTDFSACQRIAAHAAFLEYDALIVPSARDAGANIVIFVNELPADALFERVSREEVG